MAATTSVGTNQAALGDRSEPSDGNSSGGWYRFLVVGLVVFLANAGLLVLQLVAGKLLSPFVGSSLETWTTIIGVFLTGIALGNAVGGRLADRWATHVRLALILIAGSLAALWMVAWPWLLEATSWHEALPLFLRIPVLALVLCLPAGFVLSLPTAPAIRLGLADPRAAGRVAGSIFALSTLGCLVGNYLTGFLLIPSFTINGIVYVAAGLILLTAGLALGIPSRRATDTAADDPLAVADSAATTDAPNLPRLTMFRAAMIVFLCSFAGMTLELTASRVLAQNLGVSLFTWTGIIGVMLAGTALGNWLGGRLADRADPQERPERLGIYLIFAGLAIALSIAVYGVVLNLPVIKTAILGSGPIVRVVLWTFLLFFLPMLLLGTISPQVIRLTIPHPSLTGRTAGRVYAWSTTGAIVGTFAAGYVLISQLGMFRTILLAAMLPGLALMLIPGVYRKNFLLYGLSVIFGAGVVGMVRLNPQSAGITLETNYYTIRVTDVTVSAGEGPSEIPAKQLQLDYLIHSTVVLEDPTYLYYPHENIQLEFLRAAAAEAPAPRVLVIGGGGYTFPRCGAVRVPNSQFDVVEIDPGVTRVAYAHLGLDPQLPIANFNVDGRQFVAERRNQPLYDLITLDAVNDLSVPGHLLTQECNEAVRRNLKDDGVYLVTVIDILEYGRLWKAVYHTLRESFPHVELLTTDGDPDQYDPKAQKVYCLYASRRPLDLAELARKNPDSRFTHRLPPGETERWLSQERPLVLKDQFAPTDNMMSSVYLRRYVALPDTAIR